jgi:hypothetical protein
MPHFAAPDPLEELRRSVEAVNRHDFDAVFAT